MARQKKCYCSSAVHGKNVKNHSSTKRKDMGIAVPSLHIGKVD